ncbi:MAG: M20/M25/M40 family metallo-hydrolase [Steroidobacteraceae bacterium]
MRNRGLILALAGILLLLAATFLAYRPPAPRGLEAAPSEFSAARAQAILKTLVGDGLPHPIGSSANARVREVIVAQLAALGFRAELQTGLVCSDRGVCGTPTNIVALLQGAATIGTAGVAAAENDAVLLAAHYDSVPAGPGASDDGTGVAIVLEIARILAATPAPPHPVILLLTDGEEAGLLGALLFVREHPLSKRVKAAVNLDSRGVSGPSLMFETGTANAWLMHLYQAVVRRPIANSLYYVVYKSLPNDTDFTVFKSASYQGYNFAFIGDVARYHTPLDTFANASSSSIQHQGENGLSTLLALANSTELRPPVSEAVYSDFFARTVVIWPARLALPAALAALCILSAQALLLFRRRMLDRRQALWGALGAILNLVLGAVLSVGCIALLRLLGKLPPTQAVPWIAHPLPMRIAAAFIAVLSAGFVAAWFARRAGFWGFWLGGTLLIALLSVAVCAIIPGASFALLLASLAAVLGALPCLLRIAQSRPSSENATDFAVLLPCFVLFGALAPMLLQLYPALGVLAWPVSTVVLCLTTCLLLPLLSLATRRDRERVIIAGALVMMGGMLITLLLPVYSADWPQRINIEYWLDADRAQAHWWVQPASDLPTALAGAAKFESVPRARFAGSASLGYVADAPLIEMAGPDLTQISATPSAQGANAFSRTQYQLRLRSLRGAAAAFVVFPASADVREIVVATASGPQHAKLQKLRSGATRFSVVGIPPAGLEFEVDAAASTAGVQVFDQSYGLPEQAQGTRLRQARPQNATSSQEGDITVVQHTIVLDPAAGR